MEVSGVYNPITNLMELMGHETEETESAKKGSSKSSNKSSDTTSGDSSKSSDEVNLSDLSGGLGKVSINLSTGTGVLDSLEANASYLQEHFLGALNAKLEEAGIDTSQRITLARDADGKVIVANDHPDKEEIEQLFEDTPVLTQAFNSLAEQSELARKIKGTASVTFARLGGLSAYMDSISSNANENESFFLSLAQGAASSYFDLSV